MKSLSLRTLRSWLYTHLIYFPFYFYLFYFALSLILKIFTLSESFCTLDLPYNSNIIVIDREGDDKNTYESWLVHVNCASSHLGLDNNVIQQAIFTGRPETTLHWGRVFIDLISINNAQWGDLITRHPEMSRVGYSCIMDYKVVLGDGPRDPTETLDDFLISYCSG